MDNIYYKAHGNLYINLTNRCTADCVFCIRKFTTEVYGYDLRLSKEPSEEKLIETLETLDLSKYREIVFTGFGEPTLRLDVLLSVARWLKKRGLKIRLDTNGHAFLINPERNVMAELKEAGVSAISVSLNAESEEIYNRLCRPSLKSAYITMLDFVEEAIKAGIPTRTTVVEFPGVDVEKCRKLAAELGSDFYVRKLSSSA